jgi:hypothetical protein
MTGDEGAGFADDDQEYATNAAAEIDAEVAASGEEDPQNVPADRGDPEPAQQSLAGGSPGGLSCVLSSWRIGAR